MSFISKVGFTVFLILPLSSFSAILKNSDIVISAGINHTGFEYINSAAFFTDNLHLGKNLDLALKIHFCKQVAFSIGVDYSILGSKKDYSFSDSVFWYDSTRMAYNYVSTETFEGSYVFNFSYVSVPLLLAVKIGNFPLEAALGPSLGYIVKQERFDYVKGITGATKVTPIDDESQFHARMNVSLNCKILEQPLRSFVGFLYGHELSEIKSVLTSRGIQSSKEFRLYLSLSIL